MAIDWTNPFKTGGVTHRGLAKPGHPIFSDGPMIAGKPMTEWLGTSPKKTPAPTSSDSSSPTPRAPEE